MSQLYVERAIGRLVTDEEARRRFMDDPRAALMELIERGMDLSESERGALASLDSEELARFASAIDPRLQRTDLKGGTR